MLFDGNKSALYIHLWWWFHYLLMVFDGDEVTTQFWTLNRHERQFVHVLKFVC
jgi:hypothetical protein